MGTTDFMVRRNEIVSTMGRLADSEPDTMTGFNALHRAAMAEGELSSKVKELIALGISIAVRCDGCIAFHVHDALRAGASRAEVAETVGVAILMGGGPSMVYGTDAMRALDQFAPPE